jgi:hypothetical protein
VPLSCQNHRVAVFDRGGTRILGQFENLTSVRWERVRDDTSTARITLAEPTKGCVELLRQIAVNRHELVIWRGQDRVWEGPITLISRHADFFEVEARDVIHYLYRTVMHAGYDSAAYWSPNNSDPSKVFINNVEPVVDRAVRIITEELNRKKETLNPPVNIVPYITTVRHGAWPYDDERKANRKTSPFAASVYDELESMAQTGGLDYTAVGRRIILNDARVPIGKTPVVTEADFIGEVIVASYGMDGATSAYTTGDAGMVGHAVADGVNPDGVDDFYGEWEVIEQMFDEDSEAPPTQNALDNAASMNLIAKNPPPTRVRLPENTLLNPNGVLNMQDLVPGVHIPLRADLFSITLIQMQKLSNVTVEESGADGEKITISLGPAPKLFI